MNTNAILQTSLTFTAVVALLTSNAWSQATPPDWENPQLVGVNNRPAHATMVIFPDAKTALRIGPVSNAERVKSPFYRSLNGDWKYHYSSNHVARIADFWKPEFDDSRWTSIPVPSNVEMHGFGIPIYVNIQYLRSSSPAGSRRTSKRAIRWTRPALTECRDGRPPRSSGSTAVFPASWAFPCSKPANYCDAPKCYPDLSTVDGGLRVSEEILINSTPSEARVALVENGMLQEVWLERAGHTGYIGNIYQGVVSRVLPGLQAAFVDVGLERTAFLHARDMVRHDPVTTGNETPPEPLISSLLRPGDRLVVQLIKDPLEMAHRCSVRDRFLSVQHAAG